MLDCRLPATAPFHSGELAAKSSTTGPQLALLRSTAQEILCAGVPANRAAAGAEPVRLPIQGAYQSHVHILRSLADCRAIIASVNGTRRAIVIGASFIGLEATAASRARYRGPRRGGGARADGSRAWT